MQNIASSLYRVSRGEEEYLLSYNYVQVPIKYRDIFYIEKIDKQLIYHTQKEEFKERKNMKDAYMEFEPYDFLRIHSSYLVNMRYITKIDSDSVYLQKIALPFARNRKQEVRRKMESYIHKSKTVHHRHCGTTFETRNLSLLVYSEHQTLLSYRFAYRLYRKVHFLK